MNRIDETYLFLSRRYAGSDTLYAPLYGRTAESEWSETICQEQTVQSHAVSSSGTAWGKSILRALSLEPGCVTPFRLSGIGTTQCIDSPEYAKRSERAKKAIALLDQWMNDDSGYDEETWPELKKSLDRERLSSRRLFDAQSDPS